MLNILLPILSFLSLAGAFYILYKKLPALVNIPLESIQNKETFFSFLRRIIKSLFSFVHPKKIKIYTLVLAEKVLSRFRTTTLKVHETIELMSRDLKHKSQQEKWEHNWFSHKDKDKDEKGDLPTEEKK